MKKNNYTKYKILKTTPKKDDVLLISFKNPFYNIEIRFTRPYFETNTLISTCELQYADECMADEFIIVNEGDLFVVSDILTCAAIKRDDVFCILDEQDVDEVKKYFDIVKIIVLVDKDLKKYFISPEIFKDHYTPCHFRIFQRDIGVT